MRMWRAHELGDPADVLILEDVDEPVAGDGEVVIRVESIGLTYPDVLMCQGRYQVPTRLPYTPGGEVAGRVVSTGAGVTSVHEGDRVLALASRGLAQCAVARAATTFALPDSIAAPKAPALLVNYGTAYYALYERGALQAGDWLLVHGGAGGVGSAAVQLGLAAGARVIATAGGAEKVALCKQLGAEHVIDYTAEPDFVDAVRSATGGKGVAVCFDPVGGDVFLQSQRCMAWDGRLLVIGFLGGIAQAPTNHILLKNYSVVGVHWGASLARDPARLPHTVGRLLDMAAAGAIDPLVYPPFGLRGGAAALQRLADRRAWGKVVVTPDEDSEKPLA